MYSIWKIKAYNIVTPSTQNSDLKKASYDPFKKQKTAEEWLNE